MKSRIKASRNSYTTEGTRSFLTIASSSGCQHTYQFDTTKLEAVQTYCWRYEACGPTASLPEGGKVILQRLLMKIPQWENQKIKFIDGDRSNMTLANMRLGARPVKYAKTGRSRKNLTGVVGVNHRNWRDSTGRTRPYQAFTPGKQRLSLGHFANLEDAKNAREEWIERTGWEPKTRGRKTGWRKITQTLGE